ncbi:MAG TPA: ABC transporter permease [Methanocorpusculum sp.]|nr:ABC transporter permease [Methanocorpusculum sp.]
MVLSLAIRNLRINRFRTLLSMIGIIIGVFAICCMGMISGGFLSQMDTLASNSAGTMTISPIGEKVIDGEICTGFNEKELRNIEAAVKSVTKSYEILPVQNTLRSAFIGKDKKRETVSIYGLQSNDIDKVIEFKSGTKPRGATNIAIGEKLADDYKLKIGSRIDILSVSGNEISYRVVGIMKNNDQEAGKAITTDNIVLGTLEFYENVAGNNHGLYKSVIVNAKNPEEVDAIEAAIKKKMNGRPDKDSDDTVSIFKASDFLSAVSGILDLASAFTVLISAISLLVAAVAIVNVMMMSVKERTKEVGILRSIGTFKAQIMQMFLYESAMIGIAGSLVGVVLSTLASLVGFLIMMQSAEAMLTWPVLRYIPIGIGVGLAVCLAAGIYPAWKAANLNPVDAMASE